MQIKVNAGTGSSFNLAPLTAVLPNIFASTQDKIIVPEQTYPPANGGGGPNYLPIQANSITAWIGGPVGSLKLTSGGAGYTIAPAINFSGGGGTGAAAFATLAPGPLGNLTLTNGGSGYTSAPTVVFNNTGTSGSGAAATATLAGRSVASETVTKPGNGYTSLPTVTFSAPPAGGTTAVGTAVVVSRRVTAITITNSGSGYVTAPTITITGGGGSGATATAVLGPAAVASLALTNAGTGYISAPTVSFSGGGGTAAAATVAKTPSVVASVTLTNGGTGYTSAPVVNFSSVLGTGAAASALAPVTPLQPKAIQELFTLDYGRMNATLGVELPFTNFLTQTTIPYGYVDPPTEIFKDGEIQLWKITHNGVDTHFIHFHLFTVQVINRVGWDGAIKPPDANELGWKDTVRMNPLEDVVVAIRPMKQALPWDLPDSIRPMDVTAPIGAQIANQFTNVDPANQPATVSNQLVNYGWEYVWHCHILGHEEIDMMRPMVLAVAPNAPIPVSAVLGGSGTKQSITLTWTDKSLNETGFTVQRATSANGPWTTIASLPAAPKTGMNVSFTDASVARKTTYYYQVIANNVVGYTQTYAAPVVGYPHPSNDSGVAGFSAGVATQALEGTDAGTPALFLPVITN
jgi:hypothetical protein